VRSYGRAVLSAQAYGMNDEFSRVLSQQMEYYSNDPNADRINRLKGEMSQVKKFQLFISVYGSNFSNTILISAGCDV
jgi:vesicle-associated membrane protein 7